MAARGYWKLGAIGCRGASWSEQLDGKELRKKDSRLLGTVLMASPPLFNHYTVVCWTYSVALVLLYRRQYSNTSYDTVRVS